MAAASVSAKISIRELPLAETFTIARKTWNSAENVFVTLTHDGLTGIGEGAPNDHWGETAASVAAQLDGLDFASLEGPFDLEGVADLLPAGAARAALDIAMHDLAARRAGLSLSDFLGLARRARPPTSITVPIAEPDAMVERARRLADYPVLKLKVGFEGDVDVVRAIRSVYAGTIRIDANEGWDAGQAIDRLHQLRETGIELCEQPVPAGNRDELRKVAEASPIPVFADEDACTAADVAALAGVVAGVNLKLRKTGGIREFVRAVGVARAHGMSVMIGCDLESGIAITAGAHISALVDYADLDGALLLASDPFPGVRYESGNLILPDGLGLGIKETP